MAQSLTIKVLKKIIKIGDEITVDWGGHKPPSIYKVTRRYNNRLRVLILQSRFRKMEGTTQIYTLYYASLERNLGFTVKSSGVSTCDNN